MTVDGNPSRRSANYLTLFGKLHTHTHFPLHRGPLPPPLTLTGLPDFLHIDVLWSKTSTSVVLVAVCEVGEGINAMGYCFEVESEAV